MTVKLSGCISVPFAAETVYHGSTAAQRLQSWHGSGGTILRKPARIWAILGPVPI